ncbi:Proteasome subunit beta type-7 [Coemansia javaensis]|uniref:Proteasome subunit beta n=1 Tax=Coemansia javaensis TaxID=2761396 RepID=A0A9W8H4I9_9FUNG|nr:Proteasome subunit beta type-7 [Coemansia javaensis]
MDPVTLELPHTLQRPGHAVAQEPMTRPAGPIVTGTSVVAFKYRDGIIMAADCLASYGSLARFRSENRLFKVNETTLLGAAGDMGDFQYMKHKLEDVMTHEYDMDDGQRLGTKSVYKCLSNIMYGRRTAINPLWNAYVVGGVDGGERVLGYVDLYGTTYTADAVATGFGKQIAIPMLRRRVEGRADEISEEEAVAILDDCMRVLFYRDCRALNKLRRAKVTAQGVEISEPYSLETNWTYAESIVGYGA